MSSKEYHRKYYEEHNRRYTENDIDNAFNQLINSETFEPYQLTTRGFKEITNINAITITKLLKLKWIDILDKYSLKEILYNYVLDEYMVYYLFNYDCGIDYFKVNHKYISQDIIKQFTLSHIKKDCGFLKTTHQHNFVGLQKNFNEVKNIFNRIPTYKEFVEYTKINLRSYYTYFNTQKYEEIINYFNNDYEIQEYFKTKIENNVENMRKANRISSEQNTIPLELINTEFKKVFDEFYVEYCVYPTRRQFNEISEYSDIVYRKRFKTNSWNTIRIMYGYSANYDNNITETVYLKNLSDILGVTFERGNTYPWLIGVKGYHLFCDGVNEELKLVTEFDGAHHRISIYGNDDLLTKQANDRMKDKLVRENGYKMLRISSKENWQNPDFLKQRLIDVGIQIPESQTA
jgi:hypothetical protein